MYKPQYPYLLQITAGPARVRTGKVVRALFIPLSGQTRNRAGQQLLLAASRQPHIITLIQNTVNHKKFKEMIPEYPAPF